MMKLSTCLWVFVTFGLFIATFSTHFIITILSLIAFTIIGLCASLYINYTQIQNDYQIFNESRPLQFIDDDVNTNLRRSLLKGINNVEDNDSAVPINADFTGDPIIDEQIRDVLRLAFRDHIDSWYCYMSPHRKFTRQLQTNAQIMVKSLSQRIRGMNIVSYMTTKLVDAFASHLRLYRLAQTQLKELKHDDPNANLLSIFFDLEVKMERNICRDLVSEDIESCNIYLSDICDILQYLLLPVDCFKNRSFRFLFRSIFVKSILYPLLELFSDPDFINQTIVWFFKAYLVSSDTFLTVLRCCDKTEELEAVREILNHEIAVLRSKDTGGDDDFEIKQQLSSLLYVKGIINNRLKCLNDGCFDTDSTGIPSQIDLKNLKLISLPFDVVLKNNIALSYFIEFMSGIGSHGYIYFYLNVEGFKISAEQQLSELQLIKIGKSESHHSIDLESLKEAAINIYETYLSEKASHRLKIDDVICKKIHIRIMTETLSENWFDDAHNKVYDIMANDENFFAAFKKTNHYVKLLAELDLLKDFNGKGEDETDGFNPLSKSEDNSSITFDDCDSINSLEDAISTGDTTLTAETMSITSDGSGASSASGTSGYGSSVAKNSINDEYELIADIIKSGVVREFGTAYVVYVINVTKRLTEMDEKQWVTLRRYSDFYSFHKRLAEKFQNLKNISLPGKRTFNNTSKDFVEQRRHLLNAYLGQVLKVSYTHNGLKEHLNKFLMPGVYEKEKFQLTKSVQNSIFNPLKLSISNVGSAVKSGSENLLDGLTRLSKLSSLGSLSSVPFAQNSGNLNVSSANTKPQAPPPPLIDSSKVAANLDIESEDNIPLRIMLLLMDEVFDLKNKNLWLRRRIVTFLRQIIQATYGDAINRKIVDYVEEVTSAAFIAEYIKTFKNSFWPCGQLAQTRPARSHNTKMRTRVAAKMLLLSSLSDELKHIIGSETTRKGLLCIFEMFQHENLNRRFVLVLFEGILQELFTDNHFHEIFQRLHSKSKRISDPQKSSKQWPPYLYKFLGTVKKSPPTKSPLHKRRK